MNCIIVEDELKASGYLESLLKEINSDIEVLKKFDTVSESVKWLKNNKADLIFLDVHLGDGIAFEIFNHVQIDTPVVFTTSYDEYAIKAFQLNSLAYLLKPIDKTELEQVLEKYHHLYTNRSDYNLLTTPALSGFQKRFLVSGINHLLFIPVEQIAYFYVMSKHVFLTTKDGKAYQLDQSLETLEQKLNPDNFFRVNRQFIINIEAIGKMFFHERGRLKIEVIPEYKEEVVVSVDKAALFKSWLNK